MYGFDQNGRLYAVELPQRKRLWDTTKPVSERPAANGTAFIVRQGVEGDRYWLFNDSGDLIIAPPPKGYEEINRAHLIEPTEHRLRPRRRLVHAAFANRGCSVPTIPSAFAWIGSGGT